MNKIPHSFYIIRFGDSDLFGHLNNARYLDYFINAREDHLKEAYQIELADYYRQNVSWLVSSHEISYLRPAAYNEKVCISSSLLMAAPESLLVEMTMMDEKQTHLKSFLWTKYIPVNVQTGKRQNHPEAFMNFAKTIERDDADISKGYTERLKEILRQIKVNKTV